ncbi:putative esterase/lipase [Myriangium duriaei CBS 260.36]|uniref:Esterase/lipase n=1 Tax=Myriangium duriaei CBS 260.36 TaxID=1168546 RepID=A0A9P4MFS6_9PEZI|nr:putative esterase/lipase [Myriangium duriaei CBS 260.36]
MVGRKYTTHENEQIDIPSRDDNRTIRAHVYYPKHTLKPSPVLVNFHGSGFVIPMHGSDDEFALKIINNTSFTVIDVKYRLAPEDPFPAAPHDAEDAVKWVLSQPQKFDQSRVSLSGFSAGANLILGLSGQAFPSNTFRHVLAFYPPTDISRNPASKKAPDPNGKPIPARVAKLFDDCYTPAPIDRQQPLVSPTYCQPAHFGSDMLFITCAYDTLALEAEALAEAVRSAGSHVVHERMEKCNHAWDKNTKPGTVQEAAKFRAYNMAVDMLSK